MRRGHPGVTEQAHQKEAVLLGSALVRVAGREGSDQVGGGVIAAVADDLQSRKLMNCRGTSKSASFNAWMTFCRSSRFLPVTRT